MEFKLLNQKPWRHMSAPEASSGPESRPDAQHICEWPCRVANAPMKFTVAIKTGLPGNRCRWRSSSSGSWGLGAGRAGQRPAQILTVCQVCSGHFALTSCNEPQSTFLSILIQMPATHNTNKTFSTFLQCRQSDTGFNNDDDDDNSNNRGSQSLHAPKFWGRAEGKYASSWTHCQNRPRLLGRMLLRENGLELSFRDEPILCG